MPWPVPGRTSLAPKSLLPHPESPFVAMYSRGMPIPFEPFESIQPDAGDLDDLCPFVEIAPYDCGHLRGRAARGVDTGFSEASPEVGILQRLACFRDESCEYGLRQTGRCIE